MALVEKTKYKISIDPKSKNTQGLQVGDIVRRQYSDSGNTIYSLMAVVGTGTDTVLDENNEEVSRHYFVGVLLDGDEPKNGELLDFVRVTSLSNDDRSGALYMTASDSNAPYLSIIDKLGTEKSLCLPNYISTSVTSPNKNLYLVALNNGGKYVYNQRNESVYRCAKITNTANESFPVLKTIFDDTGLELGDQLLVSYKLRSSSDMGISVDLGYTDGSAYESQETIQSTLEWAYCFSVVRIDSNPHGQRSLSFSFPSTAVSGDWFEVGELNVIKLSDIANFLSANKTMLGKIDAVTDPVFGTLKGYGLYSQHLYATKDVAISGTLTAGDEKGQASTFYAGRIKKNVFKNSIDPNLLDVTKSETDLPAGIGYSCTISTRTAYILNSSVDSAWWANHLNEQVTFSVWIKAAKSATVCVRFGLNRQVDWKVSNEWVRYSATFVIDQTNPYFAFDGDASYDVEFYGPQLELGDHATPYQPTDATLADSEDEFGMWACRGGIGGTIQNPALIFAADGSLRSRDGNFYILADGSAVFRGSVEIGDSTMIDGVTLIKDGKINTAVLNVKEIFATSIDTETIVGANLTFNQGKIGGWLITETELTSETTEGADHIELSTTGGVRSIVSDIERWGFRPDGSGILAAGKISWDANGDLSVNKITATEGNIAGWIIENNYLYSGTKVESNSYATSGITLYADGTNAAIRAKNFRIDTDGSAYLKGSIVATSGQIGGWNIGTNSIYAGTEQTSDAYATSGITLYAKTNTNGSQVAAIRAVNFRIDTDGSAYLKGTINATAGSIAGWTIASSYIRKINGNNYIYLGSDGSIYHYNSELGKYGWSLNGDGTGTLGYGKIKWNSSALTVDMHLASTSGTIGGWNITEDQLTGGNVVLDSSGSIYNSNGYWKLNNDGSGWVAGSNKIWWNNTGVFHMMNGYISRFKILTDKDSDSSDTYGGLMTMGYDTGSDTDYGIWIDPDSWYAYSSNTRIYRTKYYPNGGWSVCKLTSGSNLNNNCVWDPKCKVWYTGSAMFADEKVYFNHDGSGKIGTSGMNISWTAAGVVTVNGVAASGHTHTGYAASNHSHSEYSLTSHTHSGYAASNHSHSQYSLTSHTHSGYASSSHTHSLSSITGCLSKRYFNWGNSTPTSTNSITSGLAIMCIEVTCSSLSVSGNNNAQFTFYPLQERTVYGISATMMPTSAGGVSLIPEIYTQYGSDRKLNFFLVLRNPTSSTISYSGRVSIIALIAAN